MYIYLYNFKQIDILNGIKYLIIYIFCIFNCRDLCQKIKGFIININIKGNVYIVDKIFIFWWSEVNIIFFVLFIWKNEF